MSIPVQCRCGYLYSAPDKLVGRTISCPECKAPLHVPIPEEFPELDSIGLEPEGIPTIDTVETILLNYKNQRTKGGASVPLAGPVGSGYLSLSLSFSLRGSSSPTVSLASLS